MQNPSDCNTCLNWLQYYSSSEIEFYFDINSFLMSTFISWTSFYNSGFRFLFHLQPCSSAKPASIFFHLWNNFVLNISQKGETLFILFVRVHLNCNLYSHHQCKIIMVVPNEPTSAEEAGGKKRAEECNEYTSRN